MAQQKRRHELKSEYLKYLGWCCCLERRGRGQNVIQTGHFLLEIANPVQRRNTLAPMGFRMARDDSGRQGQRPYEKQDGGLCSSQIMR